MFIQPFVVFKPLAYLLSLSYQLWLTGSISYDYWWKGGQAWCWHFGWWSFSIIRLQCGRPGFNPWVGKIPWRRKWQPTPVFLPGESHGQRSLAGCSPWGLKELDITERLSLTHSFHILGVFSMKLIMSHFLGYAKNKVIFLS